MIVERDAELVCTEDEVVGAYDRMAAAVTERLSDTRPLVLAVMLGGMVPTTHLIRRLSFELELDYLHATRYEGGTRGRELKWVAHPRSTLAERTVLVVDDILDEGHTLAAVLDHCLEAGASAAYSAVLVHKNHDRKPRLQRADFTGLEVDDRYVFGCGMDYHGRYRHLPSIYAVKE